MNEDLIKQYIENNLRIAWHYNRQTEKRTIALTLGGKVICEIPFEEPNAIYLQSETEGSKTIDYPYMPRYDI